MNTHSSSFKIFSTLFSVLYTLAFYFNWQMFRYYPQLGEFHLDLLPPKTSGPPINWYGWIATAAAASALAAFLVPRKAAERLPSSVCWIVPFAVVVVVFVYEKHWFL
jgi:hypothetical protein